MRFIAVAIALAIQGCSTAGNGGTGAVGEVKGNVHEINQRAQSVFKDMKIQLTSTDSEDSGHQQKIGGISTGDEHITVAMTSSSSDTTHVEVTAKTGTFQWDKDYANKVLAEIIQGGQGRQG